MDQEIADRIIELAWKWQQRVQWDIGFEASADWRKFRDKATQDRITAKRMRDAGQLGEMLELFQHDAERGDEIAETCHKQAVASQQNLLDLANLLREHAPKLLRLVPVVNFHDAAPADLLPWLSAMREIESEILTLVAAPPANPMEAVVADQYVTLDQMAALVKKHKRTLENRKSRQKNPLPFADVEGAGGTTAEWLYAKIRPWLEAEFKKFLPERLPDNLRRDDRV